jgi:hypothetical protein
MGKSKIISIILHPILMPIIMLYLSLNLVPNIGYSIIDYSTFIYLIFLLSTIIIPLMSVLFLIKNKIVASVEMSNYKERFTPLIITAMWMSWGYYKLCNILVYSPILKAELICAIIIVLIAAIISRYWKISLHMLAIGGLTGVIFSINILFGGLTLVAILCILFAGILGVARLNEKAHNHAQVYIGFLVGFMIEAGGVLLL